MKNNVKTKQTTNLFRVRFQEKKDEKPMEVTVEQVCSSDFIGMITLDRFVFNDLTQQVILPTEDLARKKYGQTERLHIPYHSILSIEEFTPPKLDLKKLPFMKPPTAMSDTNPPEP